MSEESSILFLVDEHDAAIRAHWILSLAPPSTAISRTVHHDSSTAATIGTVATNENSSTSTANQPAAAYDRWTVLDDSTINYGYFAKTGGKVDTPNNDDTTKGFYLTTAINYTNGPAHMGHAYEAATADTIARFARLKGEPGGVYFVTGADEHGQKIANTAAAEGKEPIEICDKYVIGFRCLNQRLRISNDDYIRTTSERHKRTARALWKKCHENGDVYLDNYSGWYNIREETFVTESEAKKSDYKDPSSGLPLKEVQEASYFFRMSKYQQRLIQYLEDHPGFIRPEQQRNSILVRLRNDELRDLSISRTTFTWGISVPEGFDPQHVMYVWVDALSNYLTGVDALEVEQEQDGVPKLTSFWPADIHIIGKDILWFHAVIWPCLLMSANLPIQKMVFAHGFVNDKEGIKMSKSLGNVVDPHDMLDKFPVDSFRWYLCKEAPYGGELAFSEDSMRDMHNADLCDTLGNLVHRATNLCGKFCNGVVPDVPPPSNPPVHLTEIINNYLDKMNNLELAGGAAVAIQGFRDVNRYLDEEAPWNKKGDEYSEARQIAVRATLEAIYALSHMLLPFAPEKTPDIFHKLHTEPVALTQLGRDCRNLKVGTQIEVGEVLYNKILSAEEIVNTEDATKKNKQDAYLEAQKKKKEKKAQNAAASQAGQEDPDQPEFTKIDIRVGKIVKVWNHEEADKLFCEQIDVGDKEGPRDIASGLRAYYTLEEMQDRKVLVVCNLKPAKMVGFSSNGMVLAAKGDDGKVELIAPPEGATIGERVFIDGLSGEPWTANLVKKKKTWETVAQGLKTGDGGVATWDGKVLQTSAGPCAAPTLVGAPIS